MSRRKSMVAREPNGRPQRARSPVEVKRLLDGAASGLKDQFWARRWGGCIFAAGSTINRGPLGVKPAMPPCARRWSVRGGGVARRDEYWELWQIST